MAAVKNAKQILGEAERGLRDLMQMELKAQRYGELAELAALADGLAQLVGRRGNTVHLDNDKANNKAQGSPVASSEKKVGSPRKSKPKSSYPRFEKDRDRLVKIGWSKKSSEEYEHRAPFSVVELLVDVIQSKYKFGEYFTAADLLPLQDEQGQAVPDYQFYLSLKWLHFEGAVTKHGRDRYSVESQQFGGDALKRIWDALPKFKGISR